MYVYLSVLAIENFMYACFMKPNGKIDIFDWE